MDGDTVDDRIDVGLVGIGDIATKAYLPVLATWPGSPRLHLASRDAQRLAHAARTFGAASTAGDLESLLERDLDALFVTAATAAHPALVSTALAAGVPVHVDKPLADRADVAADLVALARRHGTPLVTGFNRRFAPAYRAVAAADPHLVVLGKHRPDLPARLRQVVFDDFVHVVDTLRWLLGPGTRLTRVGGRLDDGRLRHVTIVLEAGDRHGIGLMDRTSGATREVLEAHTPHGTTLVHGLARSESHVGTATTVRQPGDWTPTLEVRGFHDLVDAFLRTAVDGAEPAISLDDTLATHRLCEAVVDALEAGGTP